MQFITLPLCLLLYVGVGAVLGYCWFSTISWLEVMGRGLAGAAVQIILWPLISAFLLILKLFPRLRSLVCWVGRGISQIVIKIILLFY